MVVYANSIYDTGRIASQTRVKLPTNCRECKTSNTSLYATMTSASQSLICYSQNILGPGKVMRN